MTFKLKIDSVWKKLGNAIYNSSYRIFSPIFPIQYTHTSSGCSFNAMDVSSKLPFVEIYASHTKVRIVYLCYANNFNIVHLTTSSFVQPFSNSHVCMLLFHSISIFAYAFNLHFQCGWLTKYCLPMQMIIQLICAYFDNYQVTRIKPFALISSRKLSLLWQNHHFVFQMTYFKIFKFLTMKNLNFEKLNSIRKSKACSQWKFPKIPT